MKIYCLIPTYNDSETIRYTLDSILMQKYDNYEVIIVDDGSTDSTKSVIDEYLKIHKDKIKYIYQGNSDQLNALKNASKYVKDLNSLVYILHSDDLLYDENVFTNAVSFFKNNKCDAIISDMEIIDENGSSTGTQIVRKYENKKYIIPLQLLWLGRNLYMDTAFYRSEVFLKNVYHNYVTWNGPFWLNLDENSILNVKKVDFKFFKYRVFEGNYINNMLGKLCVINGEIRVVTRLLKYYYLPCYKFQYFTYRVFNKLNIVRLFRPIYLKKETKNKKSIIKFVLMKRFTIDEIKNNTYLSSILDFYSIKSDREICINNIESSSIYTGSDLRKFNKQVINDSLPELYKDLLKEMKKGFKTICVKNYEETRIIEQVLRFLSIYPYVKVKITSNKN